MFAILLSEGMNPFYQNISSFPTIFFTFFLLLTTLYWLVAVLGFVEIDVLDFDIPDANGGVDGGDGLTNADALAGLALKLGLHGVPVTVIVSFLSLIGWLICYYAVHYLANWLPSGLLRFAAGILILFAALYIAVLVTAVLIKPIRPLFRKAEQHTPKRVLGQTAIVRTSRVDSGFGEAALEDGGAGLILKVRAAGENKFAKGDRVVLLEYLENENVYRVVSEEEFLG